MPRLHKFSLWEHIKTNASKLLIHQKCTPHTSELFQLQKISIFEINTLNTWSFNHKINYKPPPEVFDLIIENASQKDQTNFFRLNCNRPRLKLYRVKSNISIKNPSVWKNFLKFDKNQTESFFNYNFKVKSRFLGFDNGVEFSPMSSTKTHIQHRFLLFSRRNFEHFFTFLTINSWFHKLLVNISFALSLIYHICWSVHCLRSRFVLFKCFPVDICFYRDCWF